MAHKGIIILAVLFVIAAVLFYFYLASRTQKATLIQPTPTAQPTPTPQNPFNQTTNPFSQPTTYQNPFSSTASANQGYTNPFEKLK